MNSSSRRGLLFATALLPRPTYRARRDAMVAALEREMPEHVRWNVPDGGMFLWATVGAGIDTEDLLQCAVRDGVVFVPGRPFYPHKERGDGMRLNFSAMPEPRIAAGIAWLARAIHQAGSCGREKDAPRAQPERHASRCCKAGSTSGGELVGLVVTGISTSGDISALETALKAAELPLDPIQVIGPDDSTQGAASSQGLANPGLMTGDGQGTGVPGVTSGVPTAGGYGTHYFRNEALGDRLGDLEIPDDELDNYIEALQAGRSVVAYFAKPENIERVQAIFSSPTVGLVKVKTF